MSEGPDVESHTAWSAGFLGGTRSLIDSNFANYRRGQIQREAMGLDKSSHEEATGGGGDGGLAYLFLMAALAPPFIPPGWLVYMTWRALDVPGYGPFLGIPVCAFEVAIFVLSTIFFYKQASRTVAAVVTSSYSAAVYWGAVHYEGGAGAALTAVIVVLAGMLGYFAGMRFSRKPAKPSTNSENASNRYFYWALTLAMMALSWFLVDTAEGIALSL